MRRLYRFIDPDQENTDRITARRELNDYEHQQLLNNPEEVGGLLGRHMQGLTDDSPFISLSTDFNLAAQTTDTSSGGLGSIVHNAPKIAIFDVPDGLIVDAGGGGLQEGEGEVFVLLPPGGSLSDYLVSMEDNIYQGKYWNAENLE